MFTIISRNQQLFAIAQVFLDPKGLKLGISILDKRRLIADVVAARREVRSEASWNNKS